jgi:sugar (pentulose or hexulose) kinase
MLTPDTTLAGCAAIAGIACGVYKNPEDAIQYYVKKGPPVMPDVKRHEYYSTMFEKYRALRKIMMDFWYPHSVC